MRIQTNGRKIFKHDIVIYIDKKGRGYIINTNLLCSLKKTKSLTNGKPLLNDFVRKTFSIQTITRHVKSKMLKNTTNISFDDS